MFGYRFVTLTKEEAIHHRELLDLYAAIAQFSPIVPIAYIHVYRGARWASRAIFASSCSRPTDSDLQNEKTWFSSIPPKLRHLHQWLEGRLAIGCTRGECAYAAFWTAWLLFLSTHRTGDDFLHLTRRLGVVGVSQLPLQYLVGRRSTHTALRLLMGLSYERQIALHRLLGAIVFGFATLHSSLYAYFFVQSGLFLDRIQDTDVATGVCACAAILLLTMTSLHFVAQWNYRLFYTVHVAVSWLLVALLFLHTHHIRKYVLEMLAARVVDELLRRRSTRTFCGAVGLVPGTNLVRIVVPLPSRRDSAVFRPGQHVRLGRPPLGRSSAGWAADIEARCRRNPFTVASLPYHDRSLLLICRTRQGDTRRLSAIARWSTLQAAGAPLGPSIPLSIEGPYGRPFNSAALLGCDDILVVAGGVGATFGLPVFRSLAAARERGPAGAGAGGLSFVWAVRDLAEASWAFPEERGGLERRPLAGLDKQVTLYVTRRAGGDSSDADASLLGGLELAERGQGLAGQQSQRVAQRFVMRLGRPCLSSTVDHMCTAARGRVAVVVCGPDGMVKELRACVNSWRTKGRDVF